MPCQYSDVSETQARVCTELLFFPTISLARKLFVLYFCTELNANKKKEEGKINGRCKHTEFENIDSYSYFLILFIYTWFSFCLVVYFFFFGFLFSIFLSGDSVASNGVIPLHFACFSIARFVFNLCWRECWRLFSFWMLQISAVEEPAAIVSCVGSNAKTTGNVELMNTTASRVMASMPRVKIRRDCVCWCFAVLIHWNWKTIAVVKAAECGMSAHNVIRGKLIKN